MHITLCGTGSALPQRRLTSFEIDDRLGRPAGWLEGACGVRSRYEAGPGEDQMPGRHVRRSLRPASLQRISRW